MRIYLSILLMLLSYSTWAKQGNTDTIKLYFEIGVSQLSKMSTDRIDSLVYYDVLQQGKKLGIIGYADCLGDSASNVILSETRAENVQQYLQQMGVSNTDIELVLGEGEINRNMTTKDGYPYDRRVDIILGGIKVKPKPKAIIPTAANGIDISKVKKNETIRLDNIYFLPGSHMVRDTSKPELERLLNTLKLNPMLEIQIEGHICCLTQSSFDGYDYDSQDFHLSENRARAVYDYLLSKGISIERMKYKGFGKSRPLVKPERTEDDENKNRRVEIRILKK